MSGASSSRWPWASSVAVALLEACDGTGLNATVGGNLTGLAPGHTVTLEDNGGSSLVLSSNGTFEFGTTLATGATYNVSVEAQPVGQTCTVTDGSGTIDAVSDVTNVNVACAVTASITGTLSGLSAGAGVTLSNGSTALPIAANGSFAFPGTLAPGSAYAVAVAIQPTAQTCTITDATGTVPASQIVSIAVICH